MDYNGYKDMNRAATWAIDNMKAARDKGRFSIYFNDKTRKFYAVPSYFETDITLDGTPLNNIDCHYERAFLMYDGRWFMSFEDHDRGVINNVILFWRHC